MNRRRVVITGLGVVSPCGADVEENWSNLMAGRCGIGPITRFDASDYTSRIAGEVKGFRAEDYVARKDIKKMDTFIQFAIAASTMAIEDAGIEITEESALTTGVYIGSGIGGLPSIERQHKVLLDRGPGRMSPFFIPGLIINLASGQVSMRFGLKGPNSACSTACATGNHAIGDSFRLVSQGDAEVMIAGGTEAVITPLAVGGFCAMRALSQRNDAPEAASRPFDLGRDGFVIGEGAGILVLEEFERAKARGARIYAELVGYGMSADAYHISAPEPDGDGACRAMEAALRDSGADASEVDYINAHGTSTPAGDRAEAVAIGRLFGEEGIDRIFVSSTKSMTGHLLGAAGGVESVYTALSVSRGEIPPTINLLDPDPDCRLRHVREPGKQASIRMALSNSFGFGGTNACLAFRRLDG